MKKVKTAVGVVLAVVWGMVFLVMPSYAFMEDTNGNNQADVRSTMEADGKARGVATFSMNFSASANTEGNFNADGSGMMQNMFADDTTPYYYKK